MTETKIKHGVGFVGLGAMGKGMAANLQSKLGTSLHVYNRTAATAEIFCQENRNADGVGPTAVGSLSEMASSCSHVFIMLANDDACRHVVSELCDGLLGQEPQRQPFVVINCSTILPSTGNELAAQLERVGATHVACPVFGRPDAAAAGSLMAVLDANVIAGPHGDGITQLVGAFASRTLPLEAPLVSHFGDDEPPSSAATSSTPYAMKLVGNFWIASTIQVQAECMTLADKAGVPRSAFLQFMEAAYSGPIPMGYTRRMAADEFASAAGFPVTLALKDIGHMRTLAQSNDCPLPLADLFHQRMIAVKAQGGGDLDWGSAVLVTRQAAGLPTPLLTNRDA